MAQRELVEIDLAPVLGEVTFLAQVDNAELEQLRGEERITSLAFFVNSTALHLAVHSDLVNVARVLLQFGADVGARNE